MIVCLLDLVLCEIFSSKLRGASDDGPTETSITLVLVYNRDPSIVRYHLVSRLSRTSLSAPSIYEMFHGSTLEAAKEKVITASDSDETLRGQYYMRLVAETQRPVRKPETALQYEFCREPTSRISVAILLSRFLVLASSQRFTFSFGTESSFPFCHRSSSTSNDI